MKAEQIAEKWCRDNPNATTKEAFIAGLGYKAEQPKDTLENRKEKFRSEVFAYSGQYPDDMLKEFYDYWSECGGRKMRFEKQPTFEVSKRLARWSNNNIQKYGNFNFKSNASSTRKDGVEDFAQLANGVLRGLADKFN